MCHFYVLHLHCKFAPDILSANPVTFINRYRKASTCFLMKSGTGLIIVYLEIVFYWTATVPDAGLKNVSTSGRTWK